MRILSRYEKEAFIKSFLEELPKTALTLMANYPTASQGALVGKFANTAPNIVQIQDIKERWENCYWWFIHNGDISGSGRGRYSLLPPYLIIHNDGSPNARYRLCGNPAQDNRIRDIVEQNNGTYLEEITGWEWENAKLVDKQTVGIKRFGIIPSASMDTIFEQLDKLGIKIIRPEKFEDSLIDVGEINHPPINIHLQTKLPSWGSWEEYHSTKSYKDQWTLVDRTDPSTESIYRWRSNAEVKGELSKRYFLADGFRELIEIPSSFAMYWQRKLDHKYNKSKSIWVSDNILWTPEEIPFDYQHWLQLNSSFWQREKGLHKYKIESDIEKVSGIIERKLKFIIQMRTPIFTN